MSAIKLERQTAAPGDSIEAVSKQHLGFFKAGQRVTLRTRYAEYYMNATSFPAGSVCEGPYLRINPAINLNRIPDTVDPCGVKALRKLAWNGETISGEAGAITIPQKYGEPYYEVDANNQSIIMPFDGSLDVVTSCAGLWVYDVLAYQDPNERSNTQQSRLYQTRSFAANVSREVIVPMGAYAVQFAGNLVGFVAYLRQEDTGKVFAGYNTSVLLNGVIVGTEYPLGNARSFFSSSTNQFLTSFKVALP